MIYPTRVTFLAEIGNLISNRKNYIRILNYYLNSQIFSYKDEIMQVKIILINGIYLLVIG